MIRRLDNIIMRMIREPLKHKLRESWDNGPLTDQNNILHNINIIQSIINFSQSISTYIKSNSMLYRQKKQMKLNSGFRERIL